MQKILLVSFFAMGLMFSGCSTKPKSEATGHECGCGEAKKEAKHDHKHDCKDGECGLKASSK